MRHLSLPASMGTLLVALSLAYAGCTQGEKLTGSAIIASVTVSPTTVALTPGRTAQLSGRAFDEGGVQTSAALSWESASAGVAIVSSSGLVTAVGVGTTQIMVGAGEVTDVATVTVTPAPVATVALTPQNPQVTVNQTTQLTATLRDADGGVLTGRTVTWETSAAGTATVAANGLVRGVAPGSATITARSEGRAASTSVTVLVAPVASVTLTPASPVIVTGATVQLVPVLRDVTGAELTGRAVTYETSAGGIATVTAGGLVTGVGVGSATITARSEGQSGTTVITVQATPPAPVATVAVDPQGPTVNIDGTVQMTATLRSSNGTVLTGRSITWETSAASVATVGAATGLVRGVAPGTVTITARSEGQAGTSSVTVRLAPVATIAVTPAAPSIPVNGTTQLTATLRDAGGNVLTGRTVTWETSAGAVASVTAAGLVTGLSAGSSTITARSEGQAGTVVVTVQPAPVAVATITLAPLTPTINVGATSQLTATLRDAQGNVLTGRTVTWETSAGGVATVSTGGLVTGVAAGTATITARSEGQSASTTATVQLVPVATVAVTPSTPSVQVDQTVQLAATLRDAQGTVLTGRTVTWETSAAGTATVSAGLVRGVAAGSVTITARSEGQSGTATVTVTAAPPPPPPGAAADPTALPVAARQLPDFATYVGGTLRAGQSYMEPVSGVRVWKLTDNATPVANNEGMHDYSSGTVQVSRGWGANSATHTIHLTVAGGYLVDLTRGVGLSNWRRFGAPNTDLCFTFSQLPATPQIAYYTNGTSLYKINTATMQLDNTGGFPKSFASLTGSNLTWLQQDKSDTWFVMMPQDASRIIAWNRLTNETRTVVVPGLNEPHLDKDGRYVMAATNDEPNSWRLWDLQTGTLSGGISKEVHPEFVRTLVSSMDPNTNLGQQYLFDPRTMQQTTVLTGSRMSPNQQHRAGQWVQSDAELPGGDLRKQWVLWSGYSDGIGSASNWALTGGQVYQATPSVLNYDNRQSTVGVQSVRQYVTGSTTRVARQLTRVTSQAALVEGSFYWDAAVNRLYVWAQGGGSPAGRVEVRYPAWVHDGLGFMRVDGSEVRFLAHHYSVAPTYWDAPRATISADGKLALFSTNMNAAGGRPDAFAVEVPIR
jgi:uncharacterized protein YjdB